MYRYIMAIKRLQQTAQIRLVRTLVLWWKLGLTMRRLPRITSPSNLPVAWMKRLPFRMTLHLYMFVDIFDF